MAKRLQVPQEPPLSWEITEVRPGADGRTLVNARWFREVRIVRTEQRFAGAVLLVEQSNEEVARQDVLIDQIAIPGEPTEAEVLDAIEARRPEVEKQYRAGQPAHPLAALAGRRSA